jgi:hypothetical protein
MGGGVNLAAVKVGNRSLLRLQDRAVPAASVYPRVGEVMFEIGAILAVHLSAAAFVSLVLDLAT